MSLLTDILLMSDAELTKYINKVSSAGGTIRNREAAKTMLKFYKNKQLLQNIRLLVAPEIGIITRDDGTDVFVSTLISADNTPNNVTQTTAASQPYLGGDIAPTEKYAIHSPNGNVSRLMTFSQIAYTNVDTWNITVVCNYNGSNNLNSSVLGKGSDTLSNILFKSSGTNKFAFRNESGTLGTGTNFNNAIHGKLSVINFDANGTSLKISINGVLFDTITIATNINLSAIIKTFSTTSNEFYGKIYALKIQNNSASDLLEESNMYKSIFSEIESVVIGTQTWATSNFDAICTPQGNLINEIQLNSNSAEKVTNGNMTNWGGTFPNEIPTSWVAFGTHTAENYVTQSPTGQCRVVSTAGAAAGIYQICLTVGKLYKLTFDLVAITGTMEIAGIINGIYTPATITTGTKVMYGIATSAILTFKHSSTVDFTIDNVSVVEVGWTDSTNLYDAVYEATSGTAKQKTYAAVKAAAMWCHYNNDAATGAIYGKLYNWYAVKLLQMDFILSNFGYLISSDSDNIITDANASKIVGTKYWIDANGSNTNGLSLIGTGYRDLEGNFIGLKNICILWNADDNISNDEKRFGFAIRIIKA